MPNHYLNLPIPYFPIYKTQQTNDPNNPSPFKDQDPQHLHRVLKENLMMLLKKLHALGWDSVALTMTLSSDLLTTSKHSSALPIPQKFLKDIESAKNAGATKAVARQIEAYHMKMVSQGFLAFVQEIRTAILASTTHLRSLQILSRVDVLTSLRDWQNPPTYLSQDVDILGLRVDEDAHLGYFLDKCKAAYDLVVLDSIKSAPFVKARLKQMVRLGIPLEISYGRAMHNDVEFVQFIGRIRLILKFADMRKNIIFSDGYAEIEEYLASEQEFPELIKFFSPQDVANFSTLYGYRYSIGLRCVSEHVSLALERALIRKSFRGVAEILKVSTVELAKKRKYSEYVPAAKKSFKKNKKRKTNKKAANKGGSTETTTTTS